MDVKQAIITRRSYREISPVKIKDEDFKALAEAAQLAPSCYNNQPWNFAFIKDEQRLIELRKGYSKGNEWAYNGSLVIAVYAKKEDDCMLPGRDYYLFDTGIAVGMLLLRATELGLVAHPIAGFSETKVKEILRIPDEMLCIALIIIGEHNEDAVARLEGEKRDNELVRPIRKRIEDFVSID